MVELSKAGFAKQIALYIKNDDGKKAYELGSDFVKKYPQELIAQYLLATAANMTKRYEEGKLHGRKAFNLAKHEEDMLACAIQASISYLELQEYQKGFELLKEMEKKKSTAQLEEALFVFSIALKNKDEAMQHIDKLYKLNKRLAIRFAQKFIGE